MKLNPSEKVTAILAIGFFTCLPVARNEQGFQPSHSEGDPPPSPDHNFSGKIPSDSGSSDEVNTIPGLSTDNADNADSEDQIWIEKVNLEIGCLIFALNRANESQSGDYNSVSNEEEWVKRLQNEDTCRESSSNGALLEINSGWSDSERLKWVHHIRTQLECHVRAVEESKDTSLNSFCPRVWDKILCWPPAPPDTESFIQCDSHNNATRFCDSSGHWFNSSKKDRTGYTNYSACFTSSFPYEIWLPVIENISTTGYSISLVTLVISFAILISLRKLRCPRNILHLHLFASFILRALVILLKTSLQTQFDLASTGQLANRVDSNPGTWWCKFAIVLWQYFIVANYSWILMEGLYLHNLIFMALFSDSSAITFYISLGWGIPSFFVLLWAILRATLDEVGCWTVHNSSWIFLTCIRLPVALSNLANFFFFLNVTRVLFSKFRSAVNPESMKYRKLARSTLVLVPLFGVPYFLLWGLSTSSDPTVELVWLFLDQTFASFQGFFVAVLYCLMNGEVRQEVMRQYHRFKGDTFQNASHSTVMSHTKTFLSRGRTSISIHSGNDKEHKNGLQTPSPQMSRSFADQEGGSPFKGEYYPNRPKSPNCAELVKYDSSNHSRGLNIMEMTPVPMGGNSVLKPTKPSDPFEEKVPLLFLDEPPKVRNKVDSKASYQAVSTNPEWNIQAQKELSLKSSQDKMADINKTSESLILLATGTDKIPDCSSKLNTSAISKQPISNEKDLYVVLNPTTQSTTASVIPNQESEL